MYAPNNKTFAEGNKYLNKRRDTVFMYDSAQHSKDADSSQIDTQVQHTSNKI